MLDVGIDRVESSILYSDNLWGNSEFEIVVKQCEAGKNSVKSIIKAHEDLADVWELQTKSLLRCSQSMNMKINCSTKAMDLWKEIRSLMEWSGQQYKAAVAELKESIFELRITKGELKNINKLLQRKRGELSSEVQFATRNVQLAYDERFVHK